MRPAITDASTVGKNATRARPGNIQDEYKNASKYLQFGGGADGGGIKGFRARDNVRHGLEEGQALRDAAFRLIIVGGGYIWETKVEANRARIGEIHAH